MAAPPGSGVDLLAVPLARGERPAVWGLNLNAFPQGQADLAAPFAAWKARAAPLLAATGAHLYDVPYLHVTASSPAPFTHPELAGWAPEERARYTAAWRAALAGACSPGCAGWPAAPFVLRFKALELHASCAIFMVEDPSASIAAVRACVAAAAAAVAAGPEGALLARSGWKSPKIVHSTVMRIVRPTEPGAMQAAWAAAAAEWPLEGVEVTCREMVFLEEVVPYQHLDPDPAAYELCRYPYAAQGEGVAREGGGATATAKN
jgi:hypothetical protein